MNRFFLPRNRPQFDPEVTEKLKKVMDGIHRRMERDDVLIKCRDLRGGTIAQVVPRGRDLIKFDNDRFFGANPWFQAAVNVHELSHEREHTDDQSYSWWTPDLHDARSRMRSNPERLHWPTPFNNADSVAALTYALIGDHFDTLFDEFYGQPISADRFALEVARVMRGRDYQRELLQTRALVQQTVGGERADAAVLDVVREHIAELGFAQTSATLTTAAWHDPLGRPASLEDVTAALSMFGDISLVDFYRGLFAAKFVALI